MRICLAVLLSLASILMAVALAPLTESSSATAQVQNPLARKTDEMFAKLITKAESEGPVRVIVGLNTAFQPEGFLFNAQLRKLQRDEIAQAQDSMIAQLTSFNARSITRFTFIPFMAMELDAAGLKFLQNSPEVSSIEEDLPIPFTLAQSVPLIGANTAWASGFSGAGQTVAILDTGVDKAHSFLAGKVVSEACYSATTGAFTSVCPGGVDESTSPGSGVPCPFLGCDHGTHVAGIAAGKGTSFSGVARDANIISIQVASRSVLNGALNPLTSNLLNGMQRVQELSGSFSIAAVNLSLGSGINNTHCDAANAAMKAAIDNLRSIGIATVVSSGNNESTAGISAPACISSAISVGSTDDGSMGTTVNAVSFFSNTAPILNLLAPGQWITSSVPGNGTEAFRGTSMAAPHVVGAWAILKSKAPSATVDQVLQALTSTGLPITDTRNNVNITKPRIRVNLALNAVPHLLTVASSNPESGVSITVGPNDINNLGDGSTQFTRTYNQNTNVTLIAPATAGGNNFQKWQRNGSDWTTDQTTNVTINADVTMTAVYVTPPPVTQTLTVASSNPTSGVSISVSPTDNSNQGSGVTQFSRTYNQNTNVTLIAPATAGGNNFQKWQRNGSDWTTNQSTDVTIDADVTMTAVYVTPTRVLTVASSNPTSGVSISVSPTDNSNQGSGATQFTRTYNQNTNVTLIAPATAGGNNFQKWLRNGSDWTTNQSTDVTIDADVTMTAVYVTPTRVLTVASSNPTSGVSISVSPTDNNSLGNGVTQFTRTYNQNVTVNLTAPATAGGNVFQRWLRDGIELTTNQAASVTMDANHTLTAVYITPTQILTVASSNPATGVSITVSPNDNSNQGSGATQFTRTYNQNANVNLTAPATAGGNNFQKWLRDGADWTTNQSTSVTMDANHTMTAVYITPTRTLTVSSVVPNSGVSITVSPNDNSNQGNGSTQFIRTYNINTTVTLVAPASAGGSSFQRWERNGSTWSSNPSTTVTMNANQTMTAVYGTRTLTISSSNPNSGVSITVSPNDNNNQSNGTTGFSRTYNLNTTVSLTAPQTAGGNVFQKWQRNGLDWSNTRSTSVTMDNNYSLVAVYVSPPAPTQTLTVTAGNPPETPTITGVSIAVSPNDNSNLGNGATQFSRTYNHGTTVTLTAPSRLGTAFFRGWTRNGVPWTFDRAASLTMDSNYTVTALYGFAINLRGLTVASSNPNSGVSITATTDLNNLSSGTTQFTRTYNSGATATLTAPATAGGNTFQKWQRNGVDWSTNLSTSVTMDVNYTITAVYVTPTTKTLTVASSNPNSGVSITVSPDINNQGAGTTQFTRTYNPNTNVTLTAPATASGNTFQKWQRNGADWSTNPSTSVSIDVNYTMIAVYVTPPPPTRTLTLASSNPNSGVSITVSPNDNTNQGGGTTQFTRTFNQNTNVMLTTPPMVGDNNFQKWQRNGVDWSFNTMTSVLLDADYTMTAVYVSSGGGSAGLFATTSNHSLVDWLRLWLIRS